MNDEIKKIVEKTEKAFNDFKETNDKRLDEIEAKGKSDPLTEEKLGKINTAMSGFQDELKSAHKKNDERMAEMETAINRQNSADDEAKGEDLSAEIKSMSAQVGRQVSKDELVNYKNALDSYVRKNNAGASAEEIKALSVGIDPDGGYWVAPDKSGRIAKLLYETSAMRQVANVVTIGTDRLEGAYDLDEATSGWVGETEARTETDTPQIGKWEIPVHEQYAEPRATQKVLDDAAYPVEEWLEGKIADKLARTENTAFITGNGVGKPRGFLDYSTSTAEIAKATYGSLIQHVITGVSGGFHATLPGDAIIDAVFKLKNSYRMNAAFMMSRATLGEVRKLKDGQGNYLWQPDFSQRLGGLLVGYRTVEAEDMPVIAANSLSIAFGDFNKAYQIVDRQGIRILRDPFTAKPYVKFYTTKRTGGDMVDFDALKLIKFAS